MAVFKIACLILCGSFVTWNHWRRNQRRYSSLALSSTEFFLINSTLPHQQKTLPATAFLTAQQEKPATLAEQATVLLHQQTPLATLAKEQNMEVRADDTIFEWNLTSSYRLDHRCGPSFLDGQGLPSRCPVEGEHMGKSVSMGHCCSGAGYCGSSPSHCECGECQPPFAKQNMVRSLEILDEEQGSHWAAMFRDKPRPRAHRIWDDFQRFQRHKRSDVAVILGTGPSAAGMLATVPFGDSVSEKTDVWSLNMGFFHPTIRARFHYVEMKPWSRYIWLNAFSKSTPLGRARRFRARNTFFMGAESFLFTLANNDVDREAWKPWEMSADAGDVPWNKKHASCGQWDTRKPFSMETCKSRRPAEYIFPTAHQVLGDIAAEGNFFVTDIRVDPQTRHCKPGDGKRRPTKKISVQCDATMTTLLDLIVHMRYTHVVFLGFDLSSSAHFYSTYATTWLPKEAWEKEHTLGKHATASRGVLLYVQEFCKYNKLECHMFGAEQERTPFPATSLCNLPIWQSNPTQISDIIQEDVVLKRSEVLDGSSWQKCVDGFRFDIARPLIDRAFEDRFDKNTYEFDDRSVLAYLPRDARVLELGACLGIVSTLTNFHLNDPTLHVVVEANPRLLPYIQKNRRLNGASFRIVHGLVSRTLSGKFKVFDKIVAGSAHRMDNKEVGATVVQVPVFTLERISSETGITFDTLVVDIEGGELSFFKEFPEYIRRHVRLLFIEIHEGLMYKGFQAECLHEIQKLGLGLIYKRYRVMVFRKDMLVPA